MENFSKSVCTEFRPISYEGNKCYIIDVNKVVPKPIIQEGRYNGLVFLLDLNEEISTGKAVFFKAKNSALKHAIRPPSLYEDLPVQDTAGVNVHIRTLRYIGVNWCSRLGYGNTAI